jgi:DNA transformation protein
MKTASKRARRVNHLAVSENFRRFVLNQLEELGDVEPKSMFGGVGLYCDGLFFAIVAGDVLYLKADEGTRGKFEAAGSPPFDPYPGRAGKMQYYAVPVSVLESTADLAQWARAAVAVARRQARGKKGVGSI